MRVKIRLADEGDRRIWNDLVWRGGDAEIYHTYEWGEVLERGYGLYVKRLIAEEGGEIVGVLPYIHFHSVFFGEKLVSLPFSDVAGPATLEGRMDVSQDLLRELVRDAVGLDVNFVEVRKLGRDEAPLLKEGFVKGFEAYTYFLSTDQPYERVARNYSKKIRKNIRKAEREGLEVREARDKGDLSRFYRIYLERMKDFGTPPAPLSFWEAIWEIFKPRDMVKLIFAVLDDVEVAGFISLLFRDKLYFLLNVSLRDYWRFRGLNDLLFDWYIRYACSKGYKIVDFGRTRKGTGVLRFKEKGWGAERQPLNKYYFFFHGDRNPMDSVLSASSIYAKLWRTLIPKPLTPILGGWIRRRIGDA